MSVFAYIDPGSGTLLLQALIAMIGTAIFYFRSTISRFFSVFTRRKSQNSQNVDNSDEQ